MSEEIIEGQLQPPKPTGDAAVLAAFRELTDWSDEDVLHYAACTMCDPIGEEPYWCRDSPRERRFWREHEASKQRGEPVQPQPPLAAALRRVGEQVIADAKARMPLNDCAVRTSATPETIARIRQQLGDAAKARFAPGGVIPGPQAGDGICHGTAGGPYCGVCGAPVPRRPHASCPNRCDPRLA